jgi:hypothetical protein
MTVILNWRFVVARRQDVFLKIFTGVHGTGLKKPVQKVQIHGITTVGLRKEVPLSHAQARKRIPVGNSSPSSAKENTKQITNR